MATRGRHARDDGQKEFTGRVHHWSYAWVTAKQPKTKELKFRRWQQTGGARGGQAITEACKLQLCHCSQVLKLPSLGHRAVQPRAGQPSTRWSNHLNFTCPVFQGRYCLTACATEAGYYQLPAPTPHLQTSVSQSWRGHAIPTSCR